MDASGAGVKGEGAKEEAKEGGEAAGGQPPLGPEDGHASQSQDEGGLPPGVVGAAEEVSLDGKGSQEGRRKGRRASGEWVGARRCVCAGHDAAWV